MFASIEFWINFVFFPTSKQTLQGLNKAETWSPLRSSVQVKRAVKIWMQSEFTPQFINLSSLPSNSQGRLTTQLKESNFFAWLDWSLTGFHSHCICQVPASALEIHLAVLCSAGCSLSRSSYAKTVGHPYVFFNNVYLLNPTALIF